MNWQKKLTTTGIAACLVVFSTGCPSDPADTNDNDNDPDPDEEPTLEVFDISTDSLTSGTDIHGDDVQGEVEIEWEALEAERIALFANGDEVDLDACAPIDDEDEACLEGGSITHEPDEDTTYRLDVLSDADAECEIEDDEIHNPEYCDSDSADVEVFEPAILSLDRDDDRFDPDSDVTVEYEVENARDFEIGLVDDGELDEICEVGGDGVCTREDDDSGELTLTDVDGSITLSGWAENGADDDLGGVEVGDVELELHPEGAPVVRVFRADPVHVPFGGQTTLSWETEDAVEVEVESGFSDIIETDLSECSDVDEDGDGSCEIQFQDQEFQDLDVSFTATAFSEDDQESDPFQIHIVLGEEPAITEFDVVDEDDKHLPAGGDDIELAWEIDNEPTHLEMSADDDVILDTDDDTGVEFCQSSGDECDLSSDVFEVEDVEEPTTFTLTATSPMGSDNASVSVSVEGAPEIETVTVDGDDVTEEPAVVHADVATLEWSTDHTDQTELERSDKPEDGCDSSEVDWSDADGFDGDASGDYDIDQLDQHKECLRLTAIEDDAGQSATLRFKVVRAPEVESFEVTPSTTTAGDDVTLSWHAPFANEVVVDSPDTGHIDDEDLDDCTDVDEHFEGSCDVGISSGTSASDVEFTLNSIGFDDMESEGELDVTVFLGVPPEIDLFCAEAESDGECGSTTTALDDVDDIHIDWELEEDNANEVTITDEHGNVEFESSDPDQGGSITVDDVEETTTWTLDVHNDFGSDSSDVTAFFGPVIEAFDIGNEGEDGESALDAGSDREDALDVSTGDIEFSWETFDTDDTILEYGDLDDDADSCGEVNEWNEIATAGPDGSHVEHDVSENGCYRLEAHNPEQSSSVTVFVRDIPFVSALITTSEDSVSGDDGGSVTSSTSVVGAEVVTFEARYYEDAEADEPDSTEELDDCTETGLGSDADEDDVSCQQIFDGRECSHWDAIGCTDWDYDPPEDTELIEYEICVGDQNGDGSCALTDDDENVEVQWD